MKTTIKKVLKYTDYEYYMLLMDLYVAWCSEHSYSTNHFQLMLISNKLYNWFLQEYTAREKSFLYIARPFIGKLPVADLRKLYDDKTTQIKYFPKAILDDILFTAKINATKPEYNQPSKIAYHLN